MAGLIVVEWKTGATGFRPYRTAETQSLNAYWDTAETLLNSDVRQPPEQIRFTGGNPIWSLRRVMVSGVDKWCFAVQGRGKSFGTSGTCRFGFDDGRVHPAEVWQAGRETFTADDGIDPPDPTIVHDALAETLAAILVSRRRRIRVPGRPADVADAIGRLLWVLPYSLAAQWTWTTCVLSPPQSRSLITGSMPTDFAAALPHVASDLQQLLGAPASAMEELYQAVPSQRHLKAFEWLVERARAGEPLDDDRLLGGAYGGSEFLTVISARIGKLDAADIATFLNDPELHDGLAKQLQQVGDWTLANHAAALDHVAGHECSLRKTILTTLCDLQRDRPAVNILRLPTADSAVTPEWTDRLSGLLHMRGINSRNLFTALALQDGLYQRFRDRRAARDLLVRLGLQLDEYFACDTEFVAAELRAGRSEAAFAELKRAPQPFNVLLHQIPESAFQGLAPKSAASLIAEAVRATGRGRRVTAMQFQELAQIIVEAAAGHLDDEIDDWTATFIGELSREKEVISDEALARLLAGAVLGIQQLRGTHQAAPESIRDLAKTLGAGVFVPASARPLLQDPPSATPSSARFEEPATVAYTSEGHYVAQERTAGRRREVREDSARLNLPVPAASPEAGRPRPQPEPAQKWFTGLLQPRSLMAGPIDLRHLVLIGAALIAIILLAFVWIVPKLSTSPAAGLDDGVPPTATATATSPDPETTPPSVAGPQSFFINVQSDSVDAVALVERMKKMTNGDLPGWVEIVGYGTNDKDGLQIANGLADQLKHAHKALNLTTKGATVDEHLKVGTVRVTFGVR